MSTNNLGKINNTLKSRSTIYYIKIPDKKIIFSWLQNNNKNTSKREIKTALLINNYSPVTTNYFLNSSQKIQRKKLMHLIKNNILYQNNIDTLFLYLYYNDTQNLISWICFLILDVIKYNTFKNKYILYNIDEYTLIKILYKNSNRYTLYQSLTSWIKCQFILTSIPYIDKKLILTEQTLFWSNLFKKK